MPRINVRQLFYIERLLKRMCSLILSLISKVLTHKLTRMKVKKNVDNVLVSPGDLQFVLMVDGQDVVNPAKCTHSSEIHQHNPRVDTQGPIIGVPGESVVPACGPVFVLWGKGCHL